ncbi:MAG: hypothetical protein M1816_001763 [Peltula sp. TS41687]|nr:MAG: hypothetical protein M1816_001763 [Peltula sp. TS41687]
MSAFVAAIEAGAHAIETDVHLTKDKVAVLSHDVTLKRCFGRPEKIKDCDWGYLRTVRTLKEPHEPMPRLRDLLEYLALPGSEDIWVLLDIKLDNDADEVMRLIGQTILEVNPSEKPWNQRIVIGCWTADYITSCFQYLPGFPITFIGFSLSYARKLLKVPNISFNLLQKVLMGTAGQAFLRDAKAANRAVYVWTVNEENMMRWSIRNEVDGVITDDPKKFLEVCDHYDLYQEAEKISWREYLLIMWINIMAVLFGFIFKCRYGFRLDPRWTRLALASGQ